MREGESSLYKEIDIDDLDNQGSIEGNDTSDSRGHKIVTQMTTKT